MRGMGMMPGQGSQGQGRPGLIKHPENINRPQTRLSINKNIINIL